MRTCILWLFLRDWQLANNSSSLKKCCKILNAQLKQLHKRNDQSRSVVERETVEASASLIRNTSNITDEMDIDLILDKPGWSESEVAKGNPSTYMYSTRILIIAL